MLHEILLALSGHPSSLFDHQAKDEKGREATFPLLSPSEKALLSSISRLAETHRRLRSHSGSISTSHPSTICRAVAATINSVYLARFQQKIIDVESRILKKDASIVGAYNIVPLAGVVGEFDEWIRLMDWLWELALFIGPAKTGEQGRDKNDSGPCSGAQILDKLRQEVRTGYMDIEEAATTLEKVAETAWLRQMSTWVLYGRLPAFGEQDFFIQVDSDFEDEAKTFRSITRLLPKFVTAQTAASILFIGKSLNHIRSHAVSKTATNESTSRELALVPAHLHFLADVSLPISPPRLSEAINNIRLSLSRNALQELLPIEKIETTLCVLQEFFLLGRGEFAVSLISEADERVRLRHTKAPGINMQDKPGLRNLVVKEGEVTAALMRTWAALASTSEEADPSDGTLEIARTSIHLSLDRPQPARPATPGKGRGQGEELPILSNVVFNDALMSAPVSLTMDITSPLDLFLAPSEVNMYSAINAYLLGVRRAHLRLADLWRQSEMRREHPAPLGPPGSNLPSGQEKLKLRRERGRARSLEMRKIWATCGAAVFLLAEISGYFEGEVIQGSWKHFKTWIVGADDGISRPASSSSATAKATLRSSGTASPMRTSQLGGSAVRDQTDRVPHDPESLSSAHRRFLGTIAFSILLTDTPFTKTLRTFLLHVDELIAFLTRLNNVHKNLDLAQDESIVDIMVNYEQEQRDVVLELDRARKRVDSDMKSIVSRLREIDNERLGSSDTFGTHYNEDGYQPHRAGGVDRLLMKLDFGRMSNEEDEHESDHQP